MTGSAWLPAVAALANLVVLFAVGMAALGAYRWRALEDLEKVADARGERIDQLEADLKNFRATQAAERARHVQELELLNLQINTLQGQVAELQRNERDANERNLKLQRALDAAALPAPRPAHRRPPKGENP